jgi:hypothetical protein
MNLLNRLLRRRIDPTANWGPSTGRIPDFDWVTMRFGPLQFGAPLEAAAFLGRPDHFRSTKDSYAQLIYTSKGFQVDFDHGRLAYLAFLIGPEPWPTDDPPVSFSQPWLHGVGPDRIQLTQQTDQTTLKRLFGTPDSIDTDQDETILQYNHHRIARKPEALEPFPAVSYRSGNPASPHAP